MANILLLDESATAASAMKGILARGNHRLWIAADSSQALKTIRTLVRIDLLIMEIKMEGAHGLGFLQRLRGDCVLKQLPVVIYTSVDDHVLAKKALNFNIQNYLVKPYHDETIYAEIVKACANPWRNLLFEEEKSFCAQMGLSADELQRMRQSVISGIAECALLFPQYAETKPYKEVSQRISSLVEAAESSGVWIVVDYFKSLKEKIVEGNWEELKMSQDILEYLRQLILCQMNPSYVPEGWMSDSDPQKARDALERARWLESDVDTQGPLVSMPQVEALLDQVTGMPVVDTVAAAFQMTASASKKESSWSLLMDQACKDPALTALVLSAANRLERSDPSPIDDPRPAMGLLGDVKLCALARSLQTIDESLLHVPPVTWASYWSFQMGVAKVAQFSCRFLEFHDMAGLAFTAGLLHDIGKLLSVKLFPFSYQATVNYAHRNKVSLHEAERKYLGCDAREIGYHYAKKHGLPDPLCDVIRWIGTPESAPGNSELIAVVSFARDVCLHNHVGLNGDGLKACHTSLAETSSWILLHNKVYPSISLIELENNAKGYCAVIHDELLGKAPRAV